MKRLAVILIIISFMLSAFACNTEKEPPKDTSQTNAATAALTSEVKDTEPATEAQTEAPSTEAPATEPPATEAPVTEPPATEPPATEPVTEPEQPQVKGTVYTLKSVMLIGEDADSSLTLYEDMSYSIETRHAQTDELDNSFTAYTGETGGFTVEGNIVKCTADSIRMKIVYDSKEAMDLYLSSMDSAVSLGYISQAFCDFFKAACSEEGFYSKIDDLSEELIEAFTGGEPIDSTIVIDDDGVTAYDITDGEGYGEGQYFMPIDECLVTLNKDGTCEFHYEDRTEAVNGLSAYTTIYKYEGTYTDKGKDEISCLINSEKIFIQFDSSVDKAAFDIELEEEFKAGYLAQVYYDYFKAAMSEEGMVTEYEAPTEYTVKRFGPEVSHVAYFSDFLDVEDL